MARHDRIIKTTTDTPIEAPIADLQQKIDVPAAPPKNRRKRALLGTVGLCILVAAGFFGREYWTVGRFMIDTNDAYVTADVTLISSRVQGYVAQVPVGENAIVRAGDVLVRLDDGDYQIALHAAQSRVSTADDTLARIDAQAKAAEAGVAQAKAQQQMAEAQLRAAQSNSARIHQLASKDVAAQAQLDKAVEGLETAEANVASAAAAVANAEAQVGVLHAQHAEAEGAQAEMKLAVAQAQRNLDLTVLRAPADGTVANLSLEVGDLVSPGARLAALVPLDTLYIEANFKETQMDGVGLGAVAHITFDAAPGQTFEGKVASISPATGSLFSLLPADNATGNFTKVVQRVPVRIAIPTAAFDEDFLRAGLSAVIKVDSRTGQDHAATPVAVSAANPANTSQTVVE
jgi:membrane fusion protein, multidrug efflux system